MNLFDVTSFSILIVVALAASNCALIGSYLVLRRQSLLGDAISHGILPGLVIGFLLAGSRDLVPMATGALLAALGTALCTDFLRRHLRIDGDAAMGIVFTTLFAIGVILIETSASQVELDPGCVLYGQAEYAAIDRTNFGLFGWHPPRSAVSLAVVLAINTSLVTAFWKELLITSFDPQVADSVGIKAAPMSLLIQSMTALTTVAAFEAVGSILVIAMLIVPGVIGHLLSDRLLGVLIAAQIAGFITALLGLWGAIYWDTSVAGMVAVSGGALFGVTLILAPRHGWIPNLLRRWSLTVRIVEEDLLGWLYRRIESTEGSASSVTDSRPLDSPLPPHPQWLYRWARLRLRLTGSIDRWGSEAKLTEHGHSRGRRLVRRHRLWETYLSDRLALPASHLHDPAHRIEHFLDEELTQKIEEKLDRPERDPHGREVPPANGEELPRSSRDH